MNRSIPRFDELTDLRANDDELRGFDSDFDAEEDDDDDDEAFDDDSFDEEITEEEQEFDDADDYDPTMTQTKIERGEKQNG